MKMSLTKAFMQFFGKKNGQSLADFSVEIKAAVNSSRQFWVDEFTRIGYIIDDAKPTEPTA